MIRWSFPRYLRVPRHRARPRQRYRVIGRQGSANVTRCVSQGGGDDNCMNVWPPMEKIVQARTQGRTHAASQCRRLIDPLEPPTIMTRFTASSTTMAATLVDGKARIWPSVTSCASQGVSDGHCIDLGHRRKRQRRPTHKAANTPPANASD